MTGMNPTIKDRIEKIRKGIVPKGYKKSRIGIIPEEWCVKQLGNISDVYGGEMVARRHLGDEGHYYLHYGDLHALNQSLINVDDSKINLPRYDKKIDKIKDGCLLENGDVVFCDASEDYEGIGKHALIKNPSNKPFIAGLHTMVAKFKGNTLVDEYKRYIFNNFNVRKNFMFYATGISVLGITLENLNKITL